MTKLEGDAKEILDTAGAVVADKGFQGSGYVTPVKKGRPGALCPGARVQCTGEFYSRSY